MCTYVYVYICIKFVCVFHIYFHSMSIYVYVPSFYVPVECRMSKNPKINPNALWKKYKTKKCTTFNTTSPPHMYVCVWRTITLFYNRIHPQTHTHARAPTNVNDCLRTQLHNSCVKYIYAHIHMYVKCLQQQQIIMFTQRMRHAEFIQRMMSDPVVFD